MLNEPFVCSRTTGLSVTCRGPEQLGRVMPALERGNFRTHETREERVAVSRERRPVAMVVGVGVAARRMDTSARTHTPQPPPLPNALLPTPLPHTHTYTLTHPPVIHANAEEEGERTAVLRRVVWCGRVLRRVVSCSGLSDGELSDGQLSPCGAEFACPKTTVERRSNNSWTRRPLARGGSIGMHTHMHIHICIHTYTYTCTCTYTYTCTYTRVSVGTTFSPTIGPTLQC